MGKYFGTDGFRGEAGITLTADHAYKVGRFLGWYYNMLRERNGDTNLKSSRNVARLSLPTAMTVAWMMCRTRFTLVTCSAAIKNN